VKLAIGLISFPFSYLIQALIFYQFFPNGWHVTLYILSIMVTGILAKVYQSWIHRFWEMFKIRLMMMNRKRAFVQIKRSYEDLIKTLDDNLIESPQK
jgi:hypothetical protein